MAVAVRVVGMDPSISQVMSAMVLIRIPVLSVSTS